MNADTILRAFDHNQVDFILIGGMNFLLRHQPVLTFDIDFWVADTEDNLERVNRALVDLGAEWGRDESTWQPVASDFHWLQRQTVLCLTSAHGAIDIFREVRGLEGQYPACRLRAEKLVTRSGLPYISLSDRDMLACQLALPEGERRLDRLSYLKTLLGETP